MKKYAKQPTSDQKAKIKKSLDRVKVKVAEAGREIKEWHLVAPVDLTPPNVKWFDGLTNDVGFSCAWGGLILLDGLAAEFPDVIDYYFRDGKERLAQALADLPRSAVLALVS